MSERKRKRGRPRMTPITSYGTEMRMRNNIPRNIKKPKYLLDAEEESCQSRGSTPSRNFDDRGSHTSSRNSRGYNPDFDDKNSEFHYGSDFDVEATSENDAVDSDTPSLSDIGLLSDDEGVLSDTGINDHEGRTTPISVPAVLVSRHAKCEAVWLQDRTIPNLVLPPSSDDLLVPIDYLMPSLGIYEVLRHFRTLVRLSPFRFEDFCGALLNQQQTVLLTEIHIALLRALIREDESQSTHFGPMDHKDSVNIMLHLVDALTWPTVLYNYLQSDVKAHHEIVDMMNNCSYPFTTIQNRLLVLRSLTDEFLGISGVREELISEGKLRYDDHCRCCHKTGDLLCCDSCTAVYHLDCLDVVPELHVVDWTCPVCIKHQVSGVTDCLSSPEASGLLCRHDPLGYDRHGRKYWFLGRRLIVESHTGEVRYYSSVSQFRAILPLLDGIDLEQDLVENITEQQPELERQLAVTERLTENNAGSKPTALTRSNEEIAAFFSKSKEEVKTEEKHQVKEENSAIQDSQSIRDMANVEVKEEATSEVKLEPGDPSSIGSAFAVHGTDPVVKKESEGVVVEDTMTATAQLHRKYDLWGASIVGRSWMLPQHKMDEVYREKLEHLSATAVEYRLGSECGQTYINQYSSNTLALNKLQHNEDRDKKRQLSHKFSIGTTPEFKWSGTLYGTEQDFTECLRQCLQQLEQQVSPHLFHPHWAAMRKTWLAAVTSSNSSPRHFARCLVWLVAAIKPVVFHTVWHDALGHVRLLRVTALEREERRRQEKKDKKEFDSTQLDDYRNTLPVRFTKLPKHQLWKVKGEEYRAVCGDGWRWCARHRQCRSVPAYTVGLRAGPDKVMVGVSMAGGLRGLPVTPDVFNRLAVKTPGLMPTLLSPLRRQQIGDVKEEPLEGQEKNEIIISNSGAEGMTQKVEVLVTPLEDFMEDGLINVSRSLVGRSRLVYPKVPGPSPLLDGLLARRLAMPAQSGSSKNTGEEDGDVDTERSPHPGEEGQPSASGREGVIDPTIQEIPDSQRSATHRLRPAGNLLKEIRQHKLRYEALDESVFHYKCYSVSCRSGGGCYSPLCRAKAKTKEKLLNAVKNYTIVTSKPSPYPQVGVNDVIKLSEMDFSEDISNTGKKGSSDRGNSTATLSVVSRTKATTTPIGNKNSAGHVVGGSVELKDKLSDSNGKSSGQISIRLDQDLDENSQSNDALEQKFAEKAAASESCSGKVYLKKLPEANCAPKKHILRLPQVSTCRVGRDRYTLLVLPKWELRQLSRRGWRHNVSGFHHLAKSNPSVWPYQCQRPLFRHTWLYRTATLSCLSAVALQLRIVWACLRWEDMQEKGPSDGKRHITTDTEIIQTEILKRKYSGRFSEKTEYLRRKVTIPFEVPKPIREFTPSQRSGLRKRRRAQSPEDKRPESMEEWIPEEQLLLWEIRLFGERLERAANQPKKTEASTSNPSSAIKITMSGSNPSTGDLKQRLEEQLKQQRAAFQQQQRDGKTLLKISHISNTSNVKAGALVTPIKTQAVSTLAGSSPTKQLMRTKDGRIISVQTLGSIQPATSVGNSSIFSMAGGLPKVQITPQVGGNKVIRLQTVPANPRMILPRAPRPTVTTPPAVSPATVRLPNQTIHITRLPGGQLQVKGLLEGQQMIQTPDGKFQLINNASAMPVASAVAAKSVATVTSSAGNVQVTHQKPAHRMKPLQQQQQIVKVNGQQVFLRKDCVGTQIVSVGAGDALKSAGIMPNQQVQQQQQQQLLIQNTPVSNIVQVSSPGIVKVTGVQPVTVSSNTAPKTEGSSLTLRVQVRMTEQGPKTIIQGLPPSVGLTKDHIRAIQEQVRSMLAQYNLKVNQLSPIMALTLHIPTQTQTQLQQQVVRQQPQQQNAQFSSPQNINNQATDVNSVPKQPQQQVLKPVQTTPIKITMLSPGVKLPTVIAVKNNSSIAFVGTSGGGHAPIVNTSVSQNIVPADGSLTNNYNNKIGIADVASSGKTSTAGGQFILNSDYIQQTIQSALNRNDLSPDVVEKLVQLKKHTEASPADSTAALPTTPSNKRTRDLSESSEGRGRVHKRTRTSEGAEGSKPTDLCSPQGRQRGDPFASATPAKKGRRGGGGAAGIISPAEEAKRRQAVQAKLDSQLSKHKEMLKKDILKKRSFLEKDLQLQIHKELSIAKQHLQIIERKGGTSPNKTDVNSSAKKKKRRVTESENDRSRVAAPTTGSDRGVTPSKRGAKNNTVATPRKHVTEPSIKPANNKKKRKRKRKEEIVCICRTPYDEAKFYVICNLCNNYFHGDCVGITQPMLRTMSEYICDDCSNAKLNKELYCICRQPYDETCFYICCEQCEDWYHGRCIGIMQEEADDIDDYICPKCEPNNAWNHSCQRKLTSKDYVEIKKLAKSLVAHKNAWPFQEAVDPGQVPDYYKVVNEPMDLRTVEQRVRDHHYTSLAAFIKDVMLLLDNCRLYNPPNSSFVSCAATLESFFCSKVKLLKQKMTSQSRSH